MDMNTSLSFEFCCANCVQIEKLHKEINVSKSSGHDMIPPRLIKALVAAIAESIANIFNASIARLPPEWIENEVGDAAV